MRNFKELLNYIHSPQSNQIANCDNLILLNTKLIEKDKIENNKNKKYYLEKLKKINFSNKEIIRNYNNIILELSNQKYEILLNESFCTSTPLICGLGATSVLETSITLHHIWGIPYIPGSSLKGVCRQVAFWELVETEKITDEKKFTKFQEEFYGNLNFEDEDILTYQLLFGAQDFKGLVLFLDAYLDLTKDNKPFKLDIMNPHYSSYYNDDTGQTPPGDWDNPVPIYFLTIREGVNFHFTVMFDNYRWENVRNKEFEIEINNKKEKKNIPDNVKNKINKLITNNQFFENIIKKSLSFYGVGSKTRLGYGSFKL